MYYGTLNKIGVTCVEAGEEANFQLLKKKKGKSASFWLYSMYCRRAGAG